MRWGSAAAAGAAGLPVGTAGSPTRQLRAPVAGGAVGGAAVVAAMAARSREHPGMPMVGGRVTRLHRSDRAILMGYQLVGSVVDLVNLLMCEVEIRLRHRPGNGRLPTSGSSSVVTRATARFSIALI